MTQTMTRATTIVALVALATSVEPASAASGCSSDTFTIARAPLAVQICIPTSRPNAKAPLIATETLTARGETSVIRKVALDVMSSAEASHTIDDAPLQPLGIAGTLHMTIGYRAGVVRLEHALLVPGAIALK